MDEAEDGPLVELSVPVKRADLTTRMHEQIMNSDPLIYPPFFEIRDDKSSDNSLNIDTKDIFELRGSDINKRFLPGGLEGGHRVRTIIVSEKASGPVGNYFELSLNNARKADDIAPLAAAAKGKGKGKSKSKQSAGPPPRVEAPEPPNEECVKAKFHLDTQTPHIEISAYDAKTSRWVSTRIWAQEFTWTTRAPWVGFSITAIPSDPNKVAEPQETEAARLIENMCTLGKIKVVRCDIDLREAKDRVWNGLTDTRLAEIRLKAPGKEASVLEALVRCLDQSTQFGMLFTSKSSPGNLTKWTQKLNGYFRDLLCLAKWYGNFWFYRSQCIMSDLDANAIELPELPKVRWAVPRWLVTEWATTRTTSPSGQIGHSKPIAHKWQPLEFPDEYPDANETAFLLKMAVEQERNTQKRNLKALVQSDGTKWFRGKFFTIQRETNTYSVELYLDMPEKLADADVKIPAPGTRIKLAIDRDNHANPSKKNMVKMSGQVVWDESRINEATFVCVVNSNKAALKCADNGSAYPVYIEYIVDNVPFDRQIRAIADGQRGNDKTIGPDTKRVVFNCHEPATGTDALKQMTTVEQLVEFKRVLVEEFQHVPNAAQQAAAIDTTTSEIGMTTIIGPPGCGKTMMDVQIIWTHGRLGRRIMGIAPTNLARDSLVKGFLDQNSSRQPAQQVPDHEWVVFTGAQSSIAGAERLTQHQANAHSDDETQLVQKNREYWAHLRDAQSRDRAPESEHSLGSKLLRRMGVWKADARYDSLGGTKLHTWSTEYFATKEKLPFLSDADEKTEAKNHVEALEAHLVAQFMKEVRFCFCTISTSAHALLLESGIWDMVIIDEAARETRAGMATILGAFTGRIRHVTISGDHWQGGGIVIGRDSNVGYKLLSRNIFEQLADVDRKRGDDVTPTGVFMLNEGYRMSAKLMEWSNRFCYGGKIQSHRIAGSWNQPLRNTLRAYWAQCLRTTFRGSYDQIALDCNYESVVQNGGTTRINQGEAHFIAWRIKDMLAFEPPKSGNGVNYARIRGTDFITISNFTGQVSAIRQALREDSSDQQVSQKELDGVRTLLGTTNWVQGKEAAIAFYSLTVSTGTTRLAMGDHIPIGFPADVKNFNVSITRQRISRILVGNLKLFVQAANDRHPTVHRNAPFFAHITTLRDRGQIVFQEESMLWMEKHERADLADNFDAKLRDKTTFSGAALEKPENTVQSGLHNVDSRPKTTARGKPTVPSSNVKFPGLPDSKVTKNKKRGTKGAKHAAKRQQGKDADEYHGGWGQKSGGDKNIVW